MKKGYLLLLFCCLSLTNFATTWYANTGYADSLNYWWSNPDYTGTNPANFSTVGDTFMMNGDMQTIGIWSIAGTLVFDTGNFAPENNVSIGGNLIMSNDVNFNASIVVGTYAFDNDISVTLYGNLTVADNASWGNNSQSTHIVFANTASSLLSPQNIMWTSIVDGTYTGVVVNPGVTVQLLSNVNLPPSNDVADSINGTLVANNYVLNLNSNDFVLAGGASLFTQQAAGVDGAITNTGALTLSASANYIYNGTVTQTSGLNLPSNFQAGGSFTLSNPAGVSLSQLTIFNNGSTLNLNGNFWLGGNVLGIAASAVLAGTFSSTAMVIPQGGQLVRQFIADSSFTYPVGDSINYSPITLHVTATTYDVAGGSSYIGVNVTNAKHPANADSTDYLNRYWTVAAHDITGLSYTANATYVLADVVGTESNISVGEYAGLPWFKYGPADVATHTLNTSAIMDANADISGISTAGPTVVSSADTAICTGSSANLYIVSTERDTPYTYSWSPGATLIDSIGAAVTATPTVTTTYTVTVTDANGFSSTAMTTVTVNQFPNVDTVLGGGGYCAGGPGAQIWLSGSDTGVSYMVYHFGSPVGSPVLGTDSVLSLGRDTLAGSYTVTGTSVHTGCSISMYGSVPVSSIPLVFPTVSISSSAGDTLCAGTATTFTSFFSHPGFTPHFQWSVNGANVGTDTSAYTYTPTDGNRVVLRLASSEQCATPDTVADTVVMSVFPVGTPTIHITSAHGDTVCQGMTVNLSSATTFAGTAPTYTWVKNTMVVSTSSTYSFVPSNGDYIIAILNSDYRCLADTSIAFSNVIAMTVDSPIVPSVTIAGYPSIYIAAGMPDTLTATVANGGINPIFQWYINGVIQPLASSNTFDRSTYANNDSVTVLVTRRDACALSSVNSVVIHVHGVGVQEIGGGVDITLTPNPNSGTFTVKGAIGSADENVAMEVTNMLGQVVYSSSTFAQGGQLNATVNVGNSLPAGMYMLNLHMGVGNATFRFVIK